MAEENEEGLPMISPGEHPRAAFAIRRAKALGGLGGFVLAFALSMVSDASLTDALWRGILAGIVGNLVLWVAAVQWWRAYLRAEARVTVDRVVAERRARQAARAEQ